MGIEIILPLSNLHGYDNYARLHYGENQKKVLMPCEPITDENLCLSIIGNNNLQIHRLMLSEEDKKSIRVPIQQTSGEVELSLPGKSAVIVLDRECCNKGFVAKIVRTYLSNNDPDRRNDHMHLSTVKDVLKAGWVPYWAPLPVEFKPLHVRLVAKRTLKSGEDPTTDDAEALKKAFTKIC